MRTSVHESREARSGQSLVRGVRYRAPVSRVATAYKSLPGSSEASLNLRGERPVDLKWRSVHVAETEAAAAVNAHTHKCSAVRTHIHSTTNAIAIDEHTKCKTCSRPNIENPRSSSSACIDLPISQALLAIPLSSSTEPAFAHSTAPRRISTKRMKFSPKLKSLARFAPSEKSETPVPMAEKHSLPDFREDFANNRTYSARSVRSTTSSKKLQWILGADNTPTDLVSWSSSPAQLRFDVSSRDYSELLDQTVDPEYISSDDEEPEFYPALCKPSTEDSEETRSVQYVYGPESDDQFELQTATYVDDAEKTTQAKVQMTSTPNTPDVEALGIADFDTYHDDSTSPYDTYTPLSTGTLDRRAMFQSEDLSFDALCDRLLDSHLHSSETDPADLHPSDSVSLSSHSPISSSHSSTIMFPVSSATSISSSASSIISVAAEEQLAKTVVSLVADQAALDARIKLAAARDALKKVKGNVVAPNSRSLPTSPILRQSYTTPLAFAGKAGLSRIASEQAFTIRPQMTASYSTGVIPSTAFERQSSGRSSRSTRHSGRSLTPSRSDVRIGVAAPRDLSLMKKQDEQRSALQSGKGKSKVVSYMPQGHITSINEVLA